MLLIAVFLSVFVLVFFLGRHRKLNTADALHRATVAAIITTLLALIVAISASYF